MRTRGREQKTRCGVKGLEKTEPKLYVRKQMQSPVLSGAVIHLRWLRDQEATAGASEGFWV